MAGTIITVAQQKGGSGKTTLSAHLAVAGLRGGSVALLDVDPQGSLGEWLERREQRLGEDGSNLGFRTASGWGARRESRALARDYDLVVVDTPPHADREARTAMELASLVVVPVQPTPADLWATEATIDLALSERTPSLVVLNRVPPRARLTEEIVEALRKLDAPIAETRIGNRIAFAEAFAIGSTAIESAASGTAAAEAQALAAEVMAMLADS